MNNDTIVQIDPLATSNGTYMDNAVYPTTLSPNLRNITVDRTLYEYIRCFSLYKNKSMEQLIIDAMSLYFESQEDLMNELKDIK